MLNAVRAQKAFIAVVSFTLFVALLFPYAIMLLTSLKSKDTIYSIPPTFFPEEWVFTNYLDIWTVVPLRHYITNSVLLASGSTLLALICAIPAAYALARMRFSGRRIYLYAVIATQIFSPIVLLVGLFREMRWFGLMDSLWALVLINGAFFQAFAIWILSGYFASIPYSLEEAAWIDGCTRLGAVRRIVLPLALPGLVTTVIFVFIQSWNEFVVALTLILTETKKPLPVGIFSFFGRYDVDWEYVFATSLIATIPVVVLFLVIEKYLVSGLTAGGVKE
jgi:multiple sugar transport system permease protein